MVVLIVVDQFRGDYVQKYGAQWTKGLRRLLDTGAYFPLASYPYAYTVTCAGHSTIGTGAFPRTHGMIGNAWYDRDVKRSIACTNDPSVSSVAFGGRAGTERHGPRLMATNTFADELRYQSTTPPKVVAFSLKARSVIGMIGHGADLAVWEEDDGTWATSTAYASSPRADLDAYAKAHAVSDQYGRVWDRLMPPSAYFFTDDGVGETKSANVSPLFPKALTRPDGKPDLTWVNNWEHTPFVDESLADMSMTFTEGFGKGPGTDMLAVSFSSLDLVGHQFGPRSHEIQDVLFRLDIQLGRLFDTLDKRLGPNGYVVALSADHGVSPLPEQMTAMGLNAGRYTAASVNNRVIEAWKPFGSEGVSPIANGNGTAIYFTPAAMAVLRENAAARDAVAAAATSAPGIAKAFWADDLASRAVTSDSDREAAVLSYFPGRSPDLFLVPQPYWMTDATGTTHGTPYEFDQRVPVILMGFGVKKGQYLTTVTPADIAPTLAFLTGIVLPRAEGRVLSEAVMR